MVLHRISAARDRHILSHAKACLEPGEEIVEWVRIRHPENRGTGFIYLTHRSCIVYWSGIGSTPKATDLRDVRSWGVDRDADKGPVLGFETDDGSTFVQLTVGTEGMVEKVNAFLERFAAHAPAPQGPLQESSHPDDYEAKRGLRVGKETKSLATHTRRLAWTVLGITVLAAGVVLLFVPGPGILVVLLGLSLLAREYDWAQDILHWARNKYHRATERFKERRSA